MAKVVTVVRCLKLMLSRKELERIDLQAMGDQNRVNVTVALLLYDMKELLKKEPKPEPGKKAPVIKMEVKTVDKSRPNTTSRKKA